MTGWDDAEPAGDEDLMGHAVDNFVDLARSGRPPDIEEYVRQYPQIAELLRKLLPAISSLQQVLTVGQDHSAADMPPIRLGDYEL